MTPRIAFHSVEKMIARAHSASATHWVDVWFKKKNDEPVDTDVDTEHLCIFVNDAVAAYRLAHAINSAFEPYSETEHHVCERDEIPF